MTNKRYHREIIALTLIEQLGNRRIRELLAEAKTPDELFSGDLRLLQKVPGIHKKKAAEISTFERWDEVDRIMRNAEKAGAKPIALTDPEYPFLLSQIYDPPPLLWVLGEPVQLSRPGIAVVGTRKMDRYGKMQAEAWSRQLSKAGLNIVSGLAYGIDTVAHRTAVVSGGGTIAVLGSGIDKIYPRKNRGLAEQIVENGGVVVSEFLPGTDAFPSHFPRRNRIVSGLTLGVLVVQSGVKGGSMITARSALDQNREVFVVPHSLEQKIGLGNLHLIQSGQGKLVVELTDILEELQIDPATERSADPETGRVAHPETGRAVHPENEQQGANWKQKTLTDDQKQVCRLLEQGRMQVDSLAEKTGIPASGLLSLLLELELDDVISQQAGKYFELK